MQLKLKVKIYTDGACSGNPGPGGWGALLQFSEAEKKIWGYELSTTNNRMELIAAIKGLQSLKKSCTVDIYTDSKYLQQGITEWINKWLKNNWRTSANQPVKNIDLWQELYKEIGKHAVNWQWIKGHGENMGNIEADKLAVYGRDTAVKLANLNKNMGTAAYGNSN